MKRLLAVLFLILLSGVAGLGYLAVQSIEDSPLVTEQSTIANTEQARRVKNLMQRLKQGPGRKTPGLNFPCPNRIWKACWRLPRAACRTHALTHRYLSVDCRQS